ncbi:MAG: tRNA (guanosine(46)-N7)-methyltransferase TrmB [Gammaproteobacteria bacterium]
MLQKNQAPHKSIRSFIRRQGRMTQGQQQALDLYWNDFCLDPESSQDYARVFGRHAPLVFEIGFGNGDSLVQMAAENPEINYIGIEVHRPGVGHLMMKLAASGLRNVRIFCHDAVEILEHRIADGSLDGIHLFFPDPWPKKKHHKRRIVRPGFVRLVVKKLKNGGYFHAATDWQHYAESMLAELAEAKGLVNSSQTRDYCSRPSYRPLTKFEQRGMAQGHPIRDLIFRKESI